MKLHWLLSLTILAAGVSRGRNDTCSYKELLQHLKLHERSTELAEIRPVLHWNQTTHVKLDVYLMGILELDEKSQMLTTFMTLAVMWNNMFLKWDPAAFCGMDHVIAPRAKLWQPDIIINENIDYSGTPHAPYATISSMGESTTFDIYRPTARCQMNLHKFPFDSQICPITFRPIIHTLTEVELSHNRDANNMTVHVKKTMKLQGEWIFVGVEITKDTYPLEDMKIQYIKYEITLKRIPVLYVVNLMAPMIFFLMLDLGSFFLSEYRSKKIGVKATILLSMSVLLLIFQDILPVTSLQLPLIAILSIVIFTLLALSMMEAMFLCYLVDLDKCQKASSKTDADAKQDVGCQADCSMGQHILPSGPVSTPEICIEMIPTENSKMQQGNRKDGYWTRRARQIDNIYFYVYFIVSVVFLVWISIEWIY